MAALMAAIAIMMIFSLLVFQAWEDVLRREKEAEMIFRAQEIARAIQRFRVDRNTPPRSLEQLLEPGPRGQYYLRRQYKDPLVRDGVWGLLFDGPDGTVIDPGGAVDVQRLLGFADTEELKGLREQQQQNPGPAEARGMIGQIAGVRTLSADKPFRVYKGQSDYSQWQFTYHDYEQQKADGRPGRAGGRPGQNPGGRAVQPGGLSGFGRKGNNPQGRGP